MPLATVIDGRNNERRTDRQFLGQVLDAEASGGSRGHDGAAATVAFKGWSGTATHPQGPADTHTSGGIRAMERADGDFIAG